MLVRLQTSRVLASGECQQFGDLIEVGKEEGRRMIAAGQAALYEGPKPAPGKQSKQPKTEDPQ